MKPIEKTSYELFQLLRTRFSPMNIGDENADMTVDPSQAKFFSFVYREGNKDIAPVSVSIIDKRTLKVFYGNDLVENLREPARWYDLLRELRYFAKSNLMNFDARDIHKDQLDTRDFEYIKQNDAPYTEKEVEVTESKLYGGKRKSYQALENARLVIYHKRTVDEEKRGARSRQIESIFVENSSGERFRFPVNYLNGARAMARHVNEGGTPYDEVGQYIVSRVNEIRDLTRFKQLSRKPAMENSEAGEIRDRVSEALNSMKREIASLQKSRGYNQFKENFSEADDCGCDSEVDSDALKDTLTRKLWNEQFDEVLPTVERVLKDSKLTIKRDKNEEAELVDGTVDEEDIEMNTNEQDESQEHEVQENFDTTDLKPGDTILVQKPHHRKPVEYKVRRVGYDKVEVFSKNYQDKEGIDVIPSYHIVGKANNNEEVEINELSPETLGSYTKKAKKDLEWKKNLWDRTSKQANKRYRDMKNREKGIKTAVDKLTREEVELDEATPGVEKFIKDPDAKLILKDDPAADRIIQNASFRQGSGLLAFIMSDIATRIIGDNSDAVANFASQMAEDIGREGESFGTRMTPEYQSDRKMALMLAKKYLNDVKRMSTDPDYRSEVRKSPEEVYGKKKKRSGGVHEQFAEWAESIAEAVTGAVTAGPTTPTAGQQTGAAQKKTNQQVVKALSGGDTQAANQIKRVSDKMARGQKLTPAEAGIAAEVGKKALTTKNTAAATRALAQDQYSEIDEDEVDENAFNQAAAAAARANKSEFEFNGKTYKTKMDKSTAHKINESDTENDIITLFRKINR